MVCVLFLQLLLLLLLLFLEVPSVLFRRTPVRGIYFCSFQKIRKPALANYIFKFWSRSSPRIVSVLLLNIVIRRRVGQPSYHAFYKQSSYRVTLSGYLEGHM